MGETIKFWLHNARITALPQSLLPAITAVSMAYAESSFNGLLAFVAVLGISLAHLSFNLFDDYFDYKKKGHDIRNQMSQGGMRARTGKCAYITSGKATISQLLLVASLFSFLALICGLVIFVKWGLPIIIFVLISGFLGISYSAPPFKFSYRGLGEFVVALLFGPLLMAGIYYASSGTINPLIWFVSIPIGLFVANILYTHDIMDFEADKKTGKKTLCVLLNNQKAIFTVSFLFIFLPYLFIAIGVFLHYLSYEYLLTYLTIPQSVMLYYLLWQFEKHPQKTFRIRWWMQPMERWEEIKKAGIEWFMIRWFLARNILIYFCVIIIIFCNK